MLMSKKIKIAVLDDYQEISQKFADWSVLDSYSDIVVFNDHVDNQQQLIQRLASFEVICVMRERTPLNRDLLSQLPNLRLIISTGYRNASIDIKAAAEFGISIQNTEYVSSGAPELTWALLMAIARNIPVETTNFKSGNWQTTVGIDLKGKTLGIVGLGNIGSKIASFAAAFDMNVIAWSENLTAEKAAAAGAKWVSKETLFRESDFITVHLVLSDRSRNTITAAELDLMKPSAYIINTSRGPLINEEALVTALQQKTIAGAALDVYDREPLPKDHPFRKMDNLLATPHIGYVTEHTYKVFYQDTVKAIQEYIKSHNNQ